MKKVISVVISIIVVILFLLLVFLPKKDFSYNENRYLTSFPVFNIDNILSGKFMSQLESYIYDNFPFRDKLLGFKSNLYKKMGVYKQSDIYYGFDNNLYQNYSKPENMDIIIKRVNKFNDKVEADVSFMLIPTSIYVNYNEISKYNNSYDEGIILDYYRDNLNVDFIDVRKTFVDNKDDYLYYGTDHHWTTKGASLAYLEYCKYRNIDYKEYNMSVVNNKFYGTLYSKVLDNSLEYDYIEMVDDDTNYSVYFDDDKRYSDSLYNFDYLKEKDKYSFFLDNNHSLIKIENLDIDNDNSILIIKDSYANAFIPFISSNYKNIYIIDPRFYNLSISDYVKNNNIKEILFLYNILTIDDDLGIVGIR